MSKPRSRSNSAVAPWFHRKARLQTLLGNCGDDEEEGIALDRMLHGQSAIGKTRKTIDIENVRFSDKDLNSFGPLADAQFGTVELVSCRLDGRVYVRKRVSKKFALKTREQCSPQSERHILLLALKSQSRGSSSWAPQLLCAYQCPSFLNIVMEYAAGGSLWDVLESSAEGRLAATDLEWWAPQCVCAIEWLHSRAGFVHRDVKPHNFVVRPGPAARLLLIDFGSAAPLLTPGADGVQHVPRSNCLIPCGTCDYISPEILRAHEEALVALEMSDDECEDADDSDAELHGRWKRKRKENVLRNDVGYGRETDWWSLGAMLYELAFGVAPFFANDIRQTYARIMNHESNLIFDSKVSVSPSLVSLIKGLLTHHESRLGRHSADELRNHVYFRDVDWSNIHSRTSPADLLLPEFTYTKPLIPLDPENDNSETSADASKPFAFSALFQSSVTSKPDASSFHSYQQDPLATPAFGRRSMSRSGSAGSAQKSIASFIGFSWGPPKDAFDDATRIVPAEPASTEPGLCMSSFADAEVTVPQHPLITPRRPSRGTAPPSTVRITSVRRSAQSRPVSDREAMRVLVTCVGQSARKRVLESGKKPKVLLPQFGFGPPPPVIAATALGDSFGKSRPRAPSYSRLSPRSSVTSAVRKELRFDDTTTQIMPNLSYTNTFTTTFSNSGMSGGVIPYVPPPYSASDSGTISSETEGPPSPSPSPRPGSAMSMLSMSRRSATPTVSSAYVMGVPVRSSSEPPELRPRARAGSLGSVHDDGNGNGAVLEAKELQTPRRARFAGSPASSPEPPPKRVPPTPHPQAHRNGAKESQASRRTQLADSRASSPEAAKERAPATPHPRKTAKEQRTPRYTHFADSLAESREIVKERVPSTPHPQAQAQARRNTKPPLQALRGRTMSSTPARAGLRRKEAEMSSSSDEDKTIRGRSRSRSNSLSGTEDVHERDGEAHMGDAETETETETPSDEELEAQSWNSSPSSPDEYAQPGRDREHYGSLGMYDDMEQRLQRLMADLANVKLHIDGFVSQVRNEG